MTPLEQQVGELKARLDCLEAIVRSLAGDVHDAATLAATLTATLDSPSSTPEESQVLGVAFRRIRQA